MTAGSIDQKYSFQKRTETDDGYGNKEGDWLERFTIEGARRFFRGMEKVQDAASTARQKLIITVRASANSRSVTTAWRVLDVRTSETYNVLAVEPKENRRFIDFIVESGGPDG